MGVSLRGGRYICVWLEDEQRVGEGGGGQVERRYGQRRGEEERKGEKVRRRGNEKRKEDGPFFKSRAKTLPLYP